jgi:hypothetical protein
MGDVKPAIFPLCKVLTVVERPACGQFLPKFGQELTTRQLSSKMAAWTTKT